jgi:hypothetical protein
MGAVVVGVLAGGTREAEGQITEAPIVRTLVYREFNVPPFGMDVTSPHPVLSDDGRIGVVGLARAGEPIRISMLNIEQYSVEEIDTYESICACQPVLAVAPQTDNAVSTDGVQIRAATPGFAGQARLALASPEIVDLLVTDTASVLFLVARDTTTGEPDPANRRPIERGLWWLPLGGQPQQVVGPAQLAQALGTPREMLPVNFTEKGVRSLGLSRGNDIVFMSVVPGGNQIYATNLAGAALRPLLVRPVANVLNSGLNADGSYAFFNVFRTEAEMVPRGYYAGVVSFDGSALEVLAADSERFPAGFPNATNQLLDIAEEIRTILLGNTGMLVGTEGAALQLSAAGGGGAPGLAPLAYDGMYRASMSSRQTRFLYIANDRQTGAFPPLEHTALVVLDYDPPTMPPGPPTIARVFVQPPLVFAEVLTQAPAVTVSLVALGANGQVDPSIPALVMTDDGSGGDAAAGDTFYTTNALPGSAAGGTHTLRIKAEIADANGRRFATAVDVEPSRAAGTAP